MEFILTATPLTSPDIKNVSLSNFTLHNVRLPISITQCISFSGAAGDCNTSKFKIFDVSFRDVVGTSVRDPIASFQCSGAAPCENVMLENVALRLGNGTAAYGWNCDHLVGAVGFNCTGSTCGRSSPDGTC